jgi:hypothetical protein
VRTGEEWLDAATLRTDRFGGEANMVPIVEADADTIAGLVYDATIARYGLDQPPRTLADLSVHFRRETGLERLITMVSGLVHHWEHMPIIGVVSGADVLLPRMVRLHWHWPNHPGLPMARRLAQTIAEALECQVDVRLDAQCVVHEDCAGVRALGVACWLSKGER